MRARASAAGGAAASPCPPHLTEQAITLLYDEHGAAAFSLASFLTGDPGSAEDVVYEVFLAIHRRTIVHRAEHGTMRAWLLAEVRGRALGRAQPPPPHHRDGDKALRGSPADGRAAAGGGVNSWELSAGLTAMAPALRETVELAYLRGLRYPEIAAQTGEPAESVLARMCLALRQLVPPTTPGHAGR